MLRTVPVLMLAFWMSLSFSSMATADWAIENDNSRLSFVSIKADTIAEVHHFQALEGGLSADGNFVLTIILASVETGIPIRNERMRELFFDTVQFPTATLTSSLDLSPLLDLAVGEQTTIAAEAQLELLGNSNTLTIESVVARLDANTLLVSSAQPVVVNAAEFGLTQGVEQLRAIAGLPSISPAVPVSFYLTLREEAAAASAASQR